MIEILMGLVIAASLLACIFEGTFEYLTITLIATVILFIFTYQEPESDNREQEQQALANALDGMERQNSRRQNRRPLFLNDGENHTASPESLAAFEELLESSREQNSIR